MQYVIPRVPEPPKAFNEPKGDGCGMRNIKVQQIDEKRYPAVCRELPAKPLHRQARSVKYKIRIAKLPLAKDFDDFEFVGSVEPALARPISP